MIRRVVLTFFGLGLIPLAPGTWGSAGALAGALLLREALVRGGRPGWFAPILGLLWVAACAACVGWGRWAIDRWGARSRKGHDPGCVVLDEAAGQWAALLGLPLASLSGPAIIGAYVGAFVLFRVLDILKPPPARRLERLPDGWGVLLDDLVCGLYVNMIGQIVLRAGAGG